MESFVLINTQRNRIKKFKLFITNLEQAKQLMEIEYGCFYKRSSYPVMKGSRIESIETAREEYKQLLDEGWEKTSIFNSHFGN